LSSIKRVLGGSGNDSLTGSAGDDQMFGGPGNDKLGASAGHDMLTGGGGSVQPGACRRESLNDRRLQ
jgi:Ca2+-binding RTX toxin-like protein